MPFPLQRRVASVAQKCRFRITSSGLLVSHIDQTLWRVRIATQPQPDRGMDSASRLFPANIGTIAVMMLPPFSALAQDTTATALITETRVHLRRGPSIEGDSIRILPRGRHLNLVRPGSFESDFYRVVTSEGDTRWVAFPYLRPADSPSVSPSAANRRRTRVLGIEAPASSIEPSWSKLRLIRSDLKSDDGRTCPIEGRAGTTGERMSERIGRTLPQSRMRSLGMPSRIQSGCHSHEAAFQRPERTGPSSRAVGLDAMKEFRSLSPVSSPLLSRNGQAVRRRIATSRGRQTLTGISHSSGRMTE
jgi:hypothetical protein